MTILGLCGLYSFKTVHCRLLVVRGLGGLRPPCEPIASLLDPSTPPAPTVTVAVVTIVIVTRLYSTCHEVMHMCTGDH